MLHTPYVKDGTRASRPFGSDRNSRSKAGGTPVPVGSPPCFAKRPEMADILAYRVVGTALK